MLSHRLPVLGLVGRYPANYLIGRKTLPGHPDLHRGFPKLTMSVSQRTEY